MATILVIDDEPAILMVLQEIFGDEGYQVETASDGFEGLKKIKHGVKPDLIMVDLNMPDINGRDFIKILRSHLDYADVPVVILTGAGTDSANLPEPQNFQGIIQKPFHLNDLTTNIKSLLDGLLDVSL